jgi:glycosyltransferase involved in cell wall biosynthesis
VDIERFLRLPPGVREAVRKTIGLGGEFVWLAVGRFEVAKDYPNMLRAFARVHERYPDAVLLLVGRGSLQADTEALVGELGLEGVVRFLGVREDVAEVMTSADGYVMSSAWEGMPMVLLEAAAAGLPIVATRAGGNHEVVLDEASGFLVPTGQSSALSDAMLRLMSLPEEQRRSMGQRGREHVKRYYGVGRVADRWEDLYREVRARKGLSPRPTAVPPLAS